MSRTAPTFHRALRLGRAPVLLGAIASLCIGCASTPMQSLLADTSAEPANTGPVIELEPAGPGSVFPTAEVAALDALAYAHVQSRVTVASSRRVRGGAIHAVEGGFSYDEPATAPRGTLAKLRYPLGETDAAHFVYYPARARATSSAATSRSIDTRSQDLVASSDPSGRPFFYMTPERYLRVVDAPSKDPRTLARVAYSARRHTTNLSMELSGTDSVDTAASLASIPTAR